MHDETALYRKKPLPVEARQLLGSTDGQIGRDLAAWCGGSLSGTYSEPKVFVPTLEGDLVARVGDWIVKGPRAEFWPVRGAIFAETYEAADAAPANDQTSLERIREIVRRLAAHAVGFQDVLDESDRDPWAKTVRADISALCTALDKLADVAEPAPTVAVEADLRRVRKYLETRLDQVAVDPAEVYNLLAEVPLSPFYEHPACGFHWHGRDSMDIPMRDGQPVCPRCEINRLQAKHKASLCRADEINNELMEEVQRYAAGKERPVLWSVYNRMHLRAIAAEAELEHAQAAIKRVHSFLAGRWGTVDPDRVREALDGIEQPNT